MDPALLLAAGIVVVAMGVAWQVPSQAHWALLLVGFSMDPIRKVIPGQPVWLTGVVAAVLLLVYLRQRQPDLTRGRPALLAHAPELAGPVQLGSLWVLFQAVRSYEATGSAIVPIIGVLSYSAPVIAVATGYGLSRSLLGVRRVIAAYVACVAVLASTVILSFLGVKSPLLDQVGKGIVIYGGQTGVIQLHCGLIRGPEMAGWHLGTATCLFLLLAATWRRKSWLTLAIPIVGLLGTALIVTGRRKYLAAIAVFAVVWLSLSWAYRRRHVLATVSSVFLALGALAGLALGFFFDASRVDTLQAHALRVSVGGDQAQGRFTGLTWDAIPSAIEHNGWMGAGAGVGSQGSQHFVAGGVDTGWAAEGGLGKILAELGVPGLLLVFWLVACVGFRCAAFARRAARDGSEGADEACALLSILVSCAMTFTLGHQVYGDPMVLCVLGMLVGMLLRIPSFHPRGDSRPVERQETRTYRPPVHASS